MLVAALTAACSTTTHADGFVWLQSDDGRNCAIVAAGGRGAQQEGRVLGESLGEDEVCRQHPPASDCPTFSPRARMFCENRGEALPLRLLALAGDARDQGVRSIAASPNWQVASRYAMAQAWSSTQTRASGAWSALRAPGQSELEPGAGWWQRFGAAAHSAGQRVIRAVNILISPGKSGRKPDRTGWGDFPAAVAIWNGGVDPACGAVVIDTHAMVTAAHCLASAESVSLQMSCGGAEPAVATLNCLRHPSFERSVADGGCGGNRSKTCGYDVARCTSTQPLNCPNAQLAGAGRQPGPVVWLFGMRSGQPAAFRMPRANTTGSGRQEPVFPADCGADDAHRLLRTGGGGFSPHLTPGDSGHAVYGPASRGADGPDGTAVLAINTVFENDTSFAVQVSCPDVHAFLSGRDAEP